ncbi:hypothetical protein A2Y85_00650 [candidate division WOR-3 bacterium RBG_13_43_14]|uniref:FAD/NAD(P)-binding domain-containing protein n=1 Tax=candidate division WOR-3 bacterium RBG_13_43_14 TaxID=1802590 RepID=A0A1F4U6Z0_UNCW3|nr:MAG: hypothetical protein A2Y85_00650 [candidate division WOR-3 bacterium RBG_13_43_14]
MPAYEEEIESALEEGIDIRFLTTPTQVITKDTQVVGIECVKMELGSFDESGRRRPIPIKGSEYEIKINTLIQAVSEQPDLSCLGKDHDFNTSGWNTLVVDHETLATNIPGVFAGGDVTRGPNTVIEAMADGKKAALSIDKFIRGDKTEITYEVTRPSIYVEFAQLNIEELLEASRPKANKLPTPSRKKNFKEVSIKLDKKTAIQEAKRCLRCDLEVRHEDDTKEKK